MGVKYLFLLCTAMHYVAFHKLALCHSTPDPDSYIHILPPVTCRSFRQVGKGFETHPLQWGKLLLSLRWALQTQLTASSGFSFDQGGSVKTATGLQVLLKEPKYQLQAASLQREFVTITCLQFVKQVGKTVHVTLISQRNMFHNINWC